MLCNALGESECSLIRPVQNRSQASGKYTGSAKAAVTERIPMTPQSLGRVSVATPGTPVRLATEYTPCCHIRVQVIAGLTGKMYFGTQAVNHTTLVGVIKELWPNPSGGVDDSFDVAILDNQLNLADYAIDAAVATEGLIVSYWVA
jgi:hypothetical protein